MRTVNSSTENENQNLITRRQFLTICFFAMVGVLLHSALATAVTKISSHFGPRVTYSEGAYGVGTYHA